MSLARREPSWFGASSDTRYNGRFIARQASFCGTEAARGIIFAAHPQMKVECRRECLQAETPPKVASISGLTLTHTSP